MAEPAAIAIELCHKASVIRDDLEDGDSRRSGKPTFHKRYGASVAIAFSDMLMSSALSVISSLRLRDSTRESRCVEHFIDAYKDMARGQLLDISRDPTQDRRAVSMQIDALKTGTLGSLAFRLGGIIGDGKLDEIEALAHYGAEIAEAFQILNDVDNLTGGETARGRPAGTDLANGKYNLLVDYFYQHGSPHLCRRMDELLENEGSISQSEVEWARRALLDLGAGRFGETLASFLLSRSHRHLELLPPSRAKEFFIAIANEDTFRRVVF